MFRRHVPAGSFYVGKRGRIALEAILGSCVGITIIDEAAEVGGLIHLLLAEPVNNQIPVSPEKYASTGIPIFLKALYEAGASSSGMKACIAGGALVGPISELDLTLDIGGRTAEISERLLAEAGVKVVNRETGGTSGCRLALDMARLSSSIEPLLACAQATPGEAFRPPTHTQLDNAIDRVAPIPQVTLKILRMINDAVCSVSEVAKEVSRDQVLSAKVLRLCNSVFFGLRRKVDSIDHAIVMLGDKRFLRLAVSAGVHEVFPETGGYSLCKGGMYQHALVMAMVCESLAGYAGKVPGGIAYTAGLLHDIGKVVLDQYLNPVFPLFYRKMDEEKCDLITVEKEAFGIDHGEAGLRLAERWGLPETLRDAIAYHHSPEASSEARELAELTYLAELIVSRVLPGQDLNQMDMMGMQERLARMGVTQKSYTDLVDMLPPQVFSAADAAEMT